MNESEINKFFFFKAPSRKSVTQPAHYYRVKSIKSFAIMGRAGSVRSKVPQIGASMSPPQIDFYGQGQRRRYVSAVLSVCSPANPAHKHSKIIARA